MKLLVMGAGYVGMALLTSLQNQFHEIYITTTDVERVDALSLYGGHVLLLNPHDDKDLHDCIRKCDGMVILVAPKNSHNNYEETYLNTANRVSLALRDRQTPFYIVYTSSTSVCEHALMVQNHEVIGDLKNPTDEWVTEEQQLCPQSEKAKILLASEHIYLACRASVCILRLGGIYGPKRELSDRARRFSGKEIPGTGDEPTNHIHLEDIIEAIQFCIKHSLKGVYHLVNDDHRTRKEIYSILCKQMNIPVPLWNPDLPQERKGGYRVSNQKIKDAGFTFKHPY